MSTHLWSVGLQTFLFKILQIAEEIHFDHISGCLLIKLWRMIWQILCNPSTFMEACVCERESTLGQRENCWTCEWEILRKNLIVILWDVGKDEKSLVHNSAATLRWCVTATPAQNLQLGSSILAMVLFQIWILTPSHEKGKERESF